MYSAFYWAVVNGCAPFNPGRQPIGLFLCLLCFSPTSLFGLLAIWGGLGRGNWFFRDAVVLGCISLSLVIPAYELVIVDLIQAGLTIVVLAAWRNWRLSRCAEITSEAPASVPAPWQFSIRDLLLLTVVVACVSAMLAKAPPTAWEQWPALLAEGLILAALTVGAVWIALGQSRWWARLPALLLMLPSALMVLWLATWRWSCQRPTASGSIAWRVGVSRAALVVASLLILLPTAALYWRLANPLPMPETVVPNPNGYEEIVRAAKVISSVNSPDFDTATLAQLKAYDAQCGSVYGVVHAALAKPCQVPVRSVDRDMKELWADINAIREIARALYGQGKLAASEGRKADAIAAYLDDIRLGQASQRGGLVIDLLVGLTFESMGHGGIADLRKSLSAGECRAFLATLRELFNNPLPLDECLARDAAWTDRAFGWQGRLMAMLSEMTGQLDSLRQVERCCDRVLAKRRLLICALAVRAYSLEHGRNPAKLADLVPGYLPEVPKDPFGGGEMVYRLTPTGYELHSVGIDEATKQPIALDDPK